MKQRKDEGTYVRAKLEVAGAALDVLVMRVIKVTVDNLFGQGEWPLEPGRGMRKEAKMDDMGKTDLSRTTARLSSMRW